MVKLKREQHWDAAYTARGAEGVSWYQPIPRQSLALIDALRVPRDASVIDVGGGASRLSEELLARGFDDLTVLDISASALEQVRTRSGGETVQLLHEDLMHWVPHRQYDLWHDRAVLHFLVDEDERRRYVQVLEAALRVGGAVVIGAFAPDGPRVCSGLPVRRYSPAELAELLGPHFELRAEAREEHSTPRGTIQPFAWIAGRLGNSFI